MSCLCGRRASSNRLGSSSSPRRFALTSPNKGFASSQCWGSHTDELVRLPSYHRDPFDRLLVAQARGAGMTLVTADENITRYDVLQMNARA